MAFKHGRNTAVYFDGLDLSPYLNSAALSASVDTADTSTFGSSWKTSIAGTASATGSFGGLYDPGVTQLDSALNVDSGVLTLCPGGASAIGDSVRMAAVTTTSLNRSTPVGDVVAIAWDVMAQTAVSTGQVLHPLAEDTNTTTGAEKDDTAATATGWTAHLHVTAVDAGGGSWVIKLQDAAVTNTYSDVTGGAFTAATGVTSQRLVSAAGTTALRRYVRYVATRTGGGAGEGITFALCYARTNV